MSASRGISSITEKPSYAAYKRLTLIQKLGDDYNLQTQIDKIRLNGIIPPLLKQLRLPEQPSNYVLQVKYI